MTLRQWDMRSALWALLPFALVLIADQLVNHEARARLLLLVIVALSLFVVSTIDGRTAILVLFTLLPFLALARRLLISTTGWPTRDPLVLLSSVVLIMLIARLFLLERRPLTGSRLSQLVLALVFVAAVESVNPRGGGMSAGISGFVYVGLPILWFFVGREMLDEPTVRKVLWLIVPIAVVDGVYGMFQLSGLTSWDQAWVNVSGYASLIVGTTVRPFGTFSSSEEYATYLSIAIVVCVAFAFRGRKYGSNAIGLLAVPPLAVALFYDSARGSIILTFVGVFVAIGLVTGSSRRMIAVVAVCGLAAGFALHAYSSTLNAKANATKSGYVTHQVGGLTHPLSTKQSTLGNHWNLFSQGITSSLRTPLGHGTGPISKGGTSFGAATIGTEVDVSDAFVGLGLLGGVLFLVLMITTFRNATELYTRTRSTAALAICGILVVTATDWLNGGLYAVAPLVWLLIGWMARAHGDEVKARA